MYGSIHKDQICIAKSAFTCLYFHELFAISDRLFFTSPSPLSCISNTTELSAPTATAVTTHKSSILVYPYTVIGLHHDTCIILEVQLILGEVLCPDCTDLAFSIISSYVESCSANRVVSRLRTASRYTLLSIAYVVSDSCYVFV